MVVPHQLTTTNNLVMHQKIHSLILKLKSLPLLSLPPLHKVAVAVVDVVNLAQQVLLALMEVMVKTETLVKMELLVQQLLQVLHLQKILSASNVKLPLLVKF